MKLLHLPAATILLAAGLLLPLVPHPAHAAKAPMSEERMNKEATHVVRGTVLKVSSKVEKSKVETYPGVHKDTIYTITVRIRGVIKGADLKKDQEIKVLAWRPHTRKPNPPGLQGHEVIPQKGDTATFYLKGGGKEPYEPLLPNGVVVEKKGE